MLNYEPDKKVTKEDILKLHQEGFTGEEIARTLRIPWSKVWPVIRRFKKNGTS